MQREIILLHITAKFITMSRVASLYQVSKKTT